MKELGIRIDSLLTNKISSLAMQEEITPEELISIYLNYCLVRHADVIEFERQVGNKSIKRADKKRAAKKQKEDSKIHTGVSDHIAKWLKPEKIKQLESFRKK